MRGSRAAVRGRVRASQPATARGAGTRERLIEVAGQVFAELGFDGATGQDICRRAGTHTAAIVYHFGGIAGLYRAALEEARRRLVATEAIAAAVEAETDPRRKLEAFLGLIVRAVTSPVSQTWAGRLFGREFVTPSRVYRQVHDKALSERTRILRSIIAELTGLRPNDPRVARSCISIMAPCALLLLIDRRKMRRTLPELEVGAESAPQLTRHLVDFALAGLGTIGSRPRST